MRRAAFVLACALLTGCDGPNEERGERIDARTGATDGERSMISGPAERRGEQLDREASGNRR